MPIRETTIALLVARVARLERLCARLPDPALVVSTVKTAVSGAALTTAIAPLAVAATVNADLATKADASDLTSGLAAKQDAASAVNDGNVSDKVAGALTASMVQATGAKVTVNWADIPGGGFSGTDQYAITP